MILVLINGKAGYARKQGTVKLLARVNELLGIQGKAVVTESIEHLRATLQAENPESLTALVPFGGDGTVSAVLSNARAIWGMKNVPPVLTVFAGTMNEIATDIHHKKPSPLDALAELVQITRHGKVPHHTMRYPMLINEDKLGFAFGLGASTAFLNNYYRRGASVLQAIKLVMLYTLSAIVQGRLIKELFKPVTGQLIADGKQSDFVWNIMLGLTVIKLPLGVKLSTSGGPNAKPRLCYVAGVARLFKLAIALPLIWVGKLPASTGLIRSQAQTMQLSFDQPAGWHLDGDVYPPTAQIQIHVEHPVRMISL